MVFTLSLGESGAYFKLAPLVIDVSNPHEFTLLEQYVIDYPLRNMVVTDEAIYGVFADTIRVFDVNDIGNSRRSYEIGGDIRIDDIAVDDGKLYIAVSGGGGDTNNIGVVELEELTNRETQ